MTESASEFRVTVLLSFQRALSGAVTPDLRAVLVRIYPQLIRAYFLYDAEYSEEARDIVSDVEGLVLSDMVPGIETRFDIVTRRYPSAVQRHPDDETVFLRHEDDTRFETSESWQDGTVSRDVGGGHVYHDGETEIVVRGGRVYDRRSSDRDGVTIDEYLSLHGDALPIDFPPRGCLD
jgi:hypothetical protein